MVYADLKVGRCRSRAGSRGSGWLMASGAFEELQTGEFGPVTFDLLRRLVHQVRRASGFPPPEGHTVWSDDAAYDVISAMLSQKGGQRFVTICFAQAADEASLERLFLTSIKNFLIDEAKKTPRASSGAASPA